MVVKYLINMVFSILTGLVVFIATKDVNTAIIVQSIYFVGFQLLISLRS